MSYSGLWAPAPQNARLALTNSAELRNAVRQMDVESRTRYYEQSATDRATSMLDCSEGVVDFICALCSGGPLRDELQRLVSLQLQVGGDQELEDGERVVVEMDRRITRRFRDYFDELPEIIWNCCKRNCFAVLACESSVEAFDEVMRIHEASLSLQRQIGDVSDLVESRRSGVGFSHINFVPLTRPERNPTYRTDRRRLADDLKAIIAGNLPYLYGKCSSRTGAERLAHKLCSVAICGVLGVSRNLLFKRTRSRPGTGEVDRSISTQDVYTSILDVAGVRMRQHRRTGSRAGHRAVVTLPSFDCGCETGCFHEVPQERLYMLWNKFKKLAQCRNPRRKETQFLLDNMACPLLNRTISVCNKALAELFTVSEGVIADIRRVLDGIYADPGLDCDAVMEEKAVGYTYSGRHPMNRYSSSVRQQIEIYLDMVLRADPGASGGVNICRVYSPEINTQQKLRKVLAKYLGDDDIIDQPLSSSTLQRMIFEYLDEKNCKISFNQSDHNACPSCKALQYAILQYNHEAKILRSRIAAVRTTEPNLDTSSDSMEEHLKRELEIKEYQEQVSLEELDKHTSRDGRIRRFLKVLSDHFRDTENAYRSWGDPGIVQWRERHDHAMISHQDDMTKADLPSFIVTASSDITRWRYDVNAHVDAVTGDSTVFTHEQGGVNKTASSIMECILLDHLVRCRGEGIKVIVSDNASVGKNWLTTIAMPQYMVDNGLADIVIVVFLENNHGKWLADMLFGQLQIRRKRTTILGPDSLLDAFESISRKSGTTQGFVLNPLASVDFKKVLKSLGYKTEPPKDFGFIKRNIHFSSACAPGAFSRLPARAKSMLGEMLPEEAGMVRISSEPPSGRPQSELLFEERYFDVPAAEIPRNRRGQLDLQGRIGCDVLHDAPLTVPMDKQYAAAGQGVVSSRTMAHVGYNGYCFRKITAYPELRDHTDVLVKQAWPRDLISSFLASPEEPVRGSPFLRCAPENWVARRPVSHFCDDMGQPVARYSPRNMLNAKCGKGPRQELANADSPWLCTATYEEYPMPSEPQTAKPSRSAYLAFEDLRREYADVSKSLNILDVLRCVYRRMERVQGSVDGWFQRRAKIPSESVVASYIDGLRLFNERERGHPSAPIYLLQAFKSDTVVQEKVTVIRSEGSAQPEPKIFAKLFEEAARIPGELEKYEHVVEEDMERYARELKQFKTVLQRSFDEAHGLLPVQSGAGEIEHVPH